MAEVKATVVYETVKLTAKEIADTNATYQALGLPVVVIDVSPFCGKLERKPDGTWKRTQIRGLNADGNDPEQPTAGPAAVPGQ